MLSRRTEYGVDATMKIPHLNTAKESSFRTLSAKLRRGLGALFALSLFVLPGQAQAVTLEEAVARALGVSFTMKEQKEIVKRSEYSYISTIDPYLPRVDIQSYYIRSLGGQNSTGQTLISVPTVGGFTDTFASRNLFTFTGTITYRLFDGGERYARRKQAYSLLGREKEVLKGRRADTVYNIKTAFYNTLGSKSVVGSRRDALSAAERIYALARGRFEAGVARKSDTLQAEVRKGTAAINLIEAVTQYERSLEEFKSLLLYEPTDKQDAEGSLEEPKYEGDFRALIERAVAVRPDVGAQAQEIERLSMVRKERVSSWFPKIDAQFQQTRDDTHFFPEGRQDAFLLNFTYTLFDGVGRYYNMKGAESDIAAARYRLGEIKRNVGLDIMKALKDYELSKQTVSLYRGLVREATSNFEQAMGEYRVGKGDILSLLQSEKDLAQARENFITSVSKANTSLILLERVAYIDGE